MGSLAGPVLRFVTTLANGLPQSSTNGLSYWGTLAAPTFADYLLNNPLPDGYPWGNRTAEGTNQYLDGPVTGVTRKYDFTIARRDLAPDGVKRSVIVVNGQFPGPLIEANWGDWIEVTVRNQLTYEGTSIHWHGMLMKESQWMDGVPAVMQCPIAPSKSFTYRFRASLYGSSWWHAHYSGQYAGGVVGPMIIHGPKHYGYDIDLGPVFLGDWYHRTYIQIIEDLMSTTASKIFGAGVSDNNLINGKMAYDCGRITDGRECTPNAGLSQFKLTPGKSHLLRLINAGAEGLQHFSIDGHELIVIAVDFVPVRPYKVKTVSIHIAQRVDVIVVAQSNPSTKKYWMRSSIITGCTPSNQPVGLAVIHYGTPTDTTTLPTSVGWPDMDTTSCLDEPIASETPLYPIPVKAAEKEFTINVGGGFNSTGNFVWTMNGQTFRANFNDPLLLDAVNGQTTYPANQNMIRTGDAKSFRIIVNNGGGVAHPMHFHGHNVFILAQGPGTWNGVVNRASNPPRRDTAVLPSNGHLVIQIDADNPGVWPFHCHIAWHASGGLFVNFLERESDIKKIQIPMINKNTCTEWDAWTKLNIVPQIDSGV